MSLARSSLSTDPLLKFPNPQICVRCKTTIKANAPYVLDEWGDPICPVPCKDEKVIETVKKA
jgi:hypothetical protein